MLSGQNQTQVRSYLDPSERELLAWLHEEGYSVVPSKTSLGTAYQVSTPDGQTYTASGRYGLCRLYAMLP